MADSVVLEEEIDPDYEPTESEVIEYANWLGMDLDNDKDILWIAREGLKAPLPENWKPCKTTDTNEVYYFNFSTGESKWEHPCDEFYRNLYEEEKKRKMQREGLGKGGKKAKEERRRKKKERKEILEIVGKQRNRAPDQEDVAQLRSLIAEAPQLEPARLSRKGSSTLSLKPLPALSSSLLGKKPLPDIRPTTAPAMNRNDDDGVDGRPMSSSISNRIVLDDESESKAHDNFEKEKRGLNLEGHLADERLEDFSLRDAERHDTSLSELRRKHRKDCEALKAELHKELREMEEMHDEKLALLSKENHRKQQQAAKEFEDTQTKLKRDHRERLDHLEVELEDQLRRRSEKLVTEGEDELLELKRRMKEKKQMQLQRLEDSFDTTVEEARQVLSRAREEREALAEERATLRVLEQSRKKELKAAQRELEDVSTRLTQSEDELAEARLQQQRRTVELERANKEAAEQSRSKEEDLASKDEVERLLRKESSWAEAEEKLRKDIERLKAELEEKELEIRTQKRVLAKHEEQNKTLLAQLEKANNLLSIQEEDEEAKLSESISHAKIQELEREMKSMAHAHSQALADAQAESKRKDELLEQSQCRVSELTKRVSRFETQAQNLALAKKAINPDVEYENTLLDELAEQKELLETYKTRLSKSETTVSHQKKQVLEAAKTADALRLSLTEEEKRHGDTLARLSVLQHENTRLRANASALIQPKVQEQDTATCVEQGTQASLLQEELDASEREIESLHAVVEGLKDTIARKDTELESLVCPSEAEALEPKMKEGQRELEMQIDELRRSKASLSKRVEELESSKQLLIEQVKSAEVAETKQIEIVALLRQRIQQQEAQNEELKAEQMRAVGSREVRESSAVPELEATKRQLDYSKQLVEQLRDQVSVAEREAVRSAEERQSIEADLRSHLKVAQSNLARAMHENSSLRAKIERSILQPKQDLGNKVVQEQEAEESQPNDNKNKMSFELQQRLKQSEVARFEADLEVSKLRQERKRLLEELEVSCQKHIDLAAKMEEVREQNAAKAEGFVNAKLEALGSYEKRVLVEKAEVAALEAKEVELRGLNERLAVRVKQLEEDLAAFQARVNALEDDEKSAQCTIKRLQNEAADLRQLTERMKIENDTLRQTADGSAHDALALEHKAELEETLVKQVEAHVLSKLGWMNAELLLGAKENVSKNVAAVPEVDVAETVEATKLWVQERTAKIEEAKAAMHALDEAQRKNNSTEVEAIRTRIQELQFELNQSLGGGKQKSLIEAPEGQVANSFSGGQSGEASSNDHVTNGYAPVAPTDASVSSLKEFPPTGATLESTDKWKIKEEKRESRRDDMKSFAKSHSEWLLKFRSSLLVDLRSASLMDPELHITRKKSSTQFPSSRQLSKLKKRRRRKVEKLLRTSDKLKTQSINPRVL